MSETSYRAILRSSSIVGGAQVINVAVSLVKMKVVAVLLGPAGIGLAGIYLNIIQVASAIAGMGLSNVGARQIASSNAHGGSKAAAHTKRALFWITLGLALGGAALFAFVSSWIAQIIFNDVSSAADMAWLSLGVAFTVGVGSQSALLRGLRRISDLARISIYSGIIGSALGVAALLVWGTQGLLVMVLVAPTVTFLLGHQYVARLRLPKLPEVSFPTLVKEWRVMAKLGFAFMLSGLVTTAGHLASRTLVQQELGPLALGHFQAAWVIGITYLGFVVSAMSSDYYPRLTAAITDLTAARRLVNEQTEVALLLCGPALLALIALAPWVIRLLYSAEFAPAVNILRWQLMGDIFKVMSWPLGFVILASGLGRTYVFTESIGTVVLLFGLAFGLPLLGVEASGMAFLLLYIVYLPLVWWICRKRIGFFWSRPVKLQALALSSAAIVVYFAAFWSELLGLIIGLLLAVMLGVWALVRLSAMGGVGSGKVARIARLGSQIREWITTQR